MGGLTFQNEYEFLLSNLIWNQIHVAIHSYCNKN